MKRHYLKVWPESFKATAEGRKLFEYRRDDRGGFDVGDRVVLCEWQPEAKAYTGRHMRGVISFVLQSGLHELPNGFCVLGLSFPDRTPYVARAGVGDDLRSRSEMV